MWMFETDFFDEHIEAVRNRAARKAYEVMTLLLFLTSFLVLRYSGENLQAYWIIPIGIIGVGNTIRGYFEQRGGFDSRRRREALYQLGKTKKARRYIVRQVGYTTIWIITLALMWWFNSDLSISTTIAILIPIIAFAGYLQYSTLKQYLYKRPPWLKNPKEDKDLQ